VTFVAESLSRLYRHRALAEILVSRDLKARYRGTLLGFLWSFATPLLMMSIYVLVFAVYMRVAVPNYAAFLLSALLPWTCFVAGISDGMGSIVANGNLIKKVFLPSEVFPLVAVAANMIHFLLSIPVLLLVLWLSGIALNWALVAFPALFVLQFIFTYAVALILASMAVQFRDLMHILPNVVMMWFYLTPILYATDMVPVALRRWVAFNPLTGLMDAYRSIFIGGALPSAAWMGRFALGSCVLLVLGLWVFRRRQELYPELV
jgi:ABC-type polysaccharide/polyol phosphate export permease